MRTRVPFIPQLEMAECGAACLAMVASHHGHHLPLSEARDLCRIGRDGASAFAICEAAERIGLVPSAFGPLELDDLRELPLPSILHWRMNHFVVLEAMTRDGARIVDPALGRTSVATSELGEAFTGVAIAFERGASFVRRRAKRPALSRYRELVASAVPSFGVVLASVLLLEALAFVLPASSQVVIDVVIRPKHERWLVVIGVVLVLTIVLRYVLGAVRDRVLAGLQVVLDVRVMRSFVDHLLSLPIEFFERRSPGDLLSRVDGLATLRAVTAGVVLSSLDALLVFAFVALMVMYEARLAAIVVALSALRVFILLRVATRTRETEAANVTATARESTVIVETTQEPEALKAFSLEQHFADIHARRLNARLNASAETGATAARAASWLPAIDGLSRGLILWLGGREVIADRMTLGTLASFLVLETMLAPPLASLLNVALKVQQAKERLARADEVWTTAPEPRGSVDPGRLTGTLLLEAVEFRYGSSNEAVLHDVSLAVPAGRSLAVLGRSGAGKSTLAKLLTGLLVPTRGRVSIDGKDLRTLDLRRVRSQIGVVSQEVSLFDDTLRANVTVGARDAETSEVIAALRAACLDELVDSLPRGLDTRIGPNGCRLSGGQRQRLVLARALVRKPRILVLDEATSSLDRAVERRISAHLDALSCTRVIIAHRLSTVEGADDVVVLDAGRVVAQGRYRDLVREPGLLREMALSCA